MKKNNDMPKEQFICSVCGKEISGDHVIIQMCIRDSGYVEGQEHPIQEEKKSGWQAGVF